MPKRTINNYKTNHENIPEYGNTANGYQALVSNTTGDNNTANGLSALASNKTGSGNIAIGYMAGDNLASGSKNIYLGNGGGNATESGIIRIGTPGTHTATYLAGTVYADGVGIGTGTTVAGNLTINTNTYLDDHAIYLRGLSGVDRNHGLGYNGQTTTNFGTGQYQIDGPALWGFSGGLLGTKSGGDHATLQWNATSVTVNGTGTSLVITPAQLNGVASNNTVTLDIPGFGNKLGIWDDLVVSGSVTANGVLLTSDRNAKEDFAPVSAQTVLAKVAALPITEWNYKTDAAGQKHLGPMAQDFHAAFGLDGVDDKHISVIDEGGVALAAIQGLNEKLEQKLEQKQTEITGLQARLDKLEQLINTKTGGVK